VLVDCHHCLYVHAATRALLRASNRLFAKRHTELVTPTPQPPRPTPFARLQLHRLHRAPQRSEPTAPAPRPARAARTGEGSRGAGGGQQEGRRVGRRIPALRLGGEAARVEQRRTGLPIHPWMSPISSATAVRRAAGRWRGWTPRARGRGRGRRGRGGPGWRSGGRRRRGRPRAGRAGPSPACSARARSAAAPASLRRGGRRSRRATTEQAGNGRAADLAEAREVLAVSPHQIIRRRSEQRL
jgi:hypothetical protein